MFPVPRLPRTRDDLLRHPLVDPLPTSLPRITTRAMNVLCSLMPAIDLCTALYFLHLKEDGCIIIEGKERGRKVQVRESGPHDVRPYDDHGRGKCRLSRISIWSLLDLLGRFEVKQSEIFIFRVYLKSFRIPNNNALKIIAGSGCEHRFKAHRRTAARFYQHDIYNICV